MPRAARPTSSFVNDLHVLYAGWVLGNLIRSGVPAEPVYDSDGVVTNRVLIGTAETSVALIIPPPPDGWRLPL